DRIKSVQDNVQVAGDSRPRSSTIERAIKLWDNAEDNRFGEDKVLQNKVPQMRLQLKTKGRDGGLIKASARSMNNIFRDELKYVDTIIDAEEKSSNLVRLSKFDKKGGTRSAIRSMVSKHRTNIELRYSKSKEMIYDSLPKNYRGELAPEHAFFKNVASGSTEGVANNLARDLKTKYKLKSKDIFVGYADGDFVIQVDSKALLEKQITQRIGDPNSAQVKDMMNVVKTRIRGLDKQATIQFRIPNMQGGL
ncbi:unnamed protein product, partial [marine sediment metagenome]